MNASTRRHALPWLLLVLAPATVGAANPPGEDPLILTQKFEHLNMPVAKPPGSEGLQTITEMPTDVRAKVARLQAKALSANAAGIATEQDAVTTVTMQGGRKTCIQEIASNSQPTQFQRYGPGTRQDQIVVLRGDLINLCK